MPRSLVGLDIGSTGVRAAEFAPGRRRAALRHFAEVPLEPGVVRAGAVVDPPALTEALRTLWSRGKFGTRAVTLGIANAGVLVRQLDLDWMPPADFRQALRYQVQDVLPFSVDEANLDYHLLDELEVPGEGGEPRRVARILLVAAARDMVDTFVEAAREAKLRVTGVDLMPFALLRARAPYAAKAEPTGVTEAIVDVGADVVSLVVHTDGTPRYVRMVPGIGGDTVTQAVRERYDWTWEDAERTKVYVGLPGHAHLDEEQRRIVGERHDGLDHAAQRVVAQAAAALADEIAATLAFYRDSAADADPLAGAEPGEDATAVGRVLLTGSGALLGGFDELLAERVGAPVERLDVLRHVRTPRRFHVQPTSSLAVPAGLCLGGAR